MSVETIGYCAGIVGKPLRAHGHDVAADELERLIGGLADPAGAENALKHLIAQSDIDVLGSLPIASMSLTEWWAWLGRLREACREELERLQLEAVRAEEPSYEFIDWVPAAVRRRAAEPRPNPAAVLSADGRRGHGLAFAGSAALAAVLAWSAAMISVAPPADPTALFAWAGVGALAALSLAGLALRGLRWRPDRIVPAE